MVKQSSLRPRSRRTAITTCQNGEGEGTRRLKLRTESERSELIYYRDHQEADSRVSHFQLWRIPDPKVVEVLEAALGMRAVVRKRRERWCKDQDGHDIEERAEEYLRLLLPHIGA